MRVFRTAASILFVCSCSFSGAEPGEGPGSDGGTLIDSGIDGRMVSVDSAVPLGNFDPPTPIASISGDDDADDPSVTGDRLELYFSSDRDGTEDIFVVKRAAIGDPWGAPAAVSEAERLVAIFGWLTAHLFRSHSTPRCL